MSSAIAAASSNKTHLRLLTLKMYLEHIDKNNLINEPRELECAICYKQISNTFFACDDPCTKTFHTSCMEKTIEQTEETAYEEDEEAHHRCCYCRRDFDLDQYCNQLFARRLQTLSASGYNVDDALDHLKKVINGEEHDEDYEYSIYEIRDEVSFMKKPKQAKRSEFKKKMRTNKMPRAFIKQNIGGRRR